MDQSQLLVATRQGVVPLDLIMVNRSSCYRYDSVIRGLTRSHAHDSRVLLFFNENGNEVVSHRLCFDL